MIMVANSCAGHADRYNILVWVAWAVATTSDSSLGMDTDGLISWKYILMKGVFGGFGTGGDECTIL